MPPWLRVARGELGVAELPGRQHAARILEYHAATTLRATADEVPWCSAFVSWCLERAGIPSTRSASARSYLEWGQPLLLRRPRLGCVAVFRRGSDPAQGHVGFYVGEAGASVQILGGNQGDRVCLKDLPRRDLLAFRWPGSEQDT